MMYSSRCMKLLFCTAAVAMLLIAIVSIVTLPAQQRGEAQNTKNNSSRIVRMRTYSIPLYAKFGKAFGGRKQLIALSCNLRVVRDAQLLAELDSCLRLFRCPMKLVDNGYDDSRFVALLYRSNGSCDTLSIENGGAPLWYNARSYFCNPALLRCLTKVISNYAPGGDSLTIPRSFDMRPEDLSHMISLCDSSHCEETR